MEIRIPETREEVLALLGAGPARDTALFAVADRVRHERMGDAVYLRGIIEFSNRCTKDCLYCGIRAGNRKVERFTMDEDEVLAGARQMAQGGSTTIVLQAGEAPAFGDERLGELIRRIKRETALAVTLSVGCRPQETYRYWQECGMDRYLLRFETSDPRLYARLHPDSTLAERLASLRELAALGVQVGSGFLVGVPGEDIGILADNILLCREYALDMIGIGPFIPHPDTPLGGERNAYADDPGIFYRAVAVLRLVNPDAHIPATTAYDAVFPEGGRDRLLERGANVFMPSYTPRSYRRAYLLYPDKPCVDEEAGDCEACVRLRLAALGRPVGEDAGHARRGAAPGR